jgi:hypothetical protein
MLMNDIIYLQIRGDNGLGGQSTGGKTLNMGGEFGQKKRGRRGANKTLEGHMSAAMSGRAQHSES